MTEPISKKDDTAKVSEETQAGAGVPQGTPDQTSGDANTGQPTVEELLQARQELEKQLAASEQNLNRMKSTFQRRETETVAQHQARIKNLSEELDAVRTAGMDEAERIKYENEKLRKELEEERRNAAAAQQTAQEAQDARQWSSYFSTFDIDFDTLSGDTLQDRVSEGLNKLAEVHKKGTTPDTAPKTKGKKPIEAPDVDTTNPTEVSKRATWDDLIEKFKVGNEHPDKTIERIFSKMDQGELDPDILLPKPTK